MKVYLVCDYTDEKARLINGCPDIGVEYMGACGGRALLEDGTKIGQHHSSSFGFLRGDLKSKASNLDNVEFIDLIGKETPGRFKVIGAEK